MASPDGAFVTDLGGFSLPPIPEHECFTGRGELQLITPALSRASSLSGGSGSGGSGHLSLLSSSLGGTLGHDEEDDGDVETAATAASLAGNAGLFDGGHHGGCGEGCSMRESLSRLSSHHDLAFEWSMLCQECTECWSGTGKQASQRDPNDPIGGRGVSKWERC